MATFHAGQGRLADALSLIPVSDRRAVVSLLRHGKLDNRVPQLSRNGDAWRLVEELKHAYKYTPILP